MKPWEKFQAAKVEEPSDSPKPWETYALAKSQIENDDKPVPAFIEGVGDIATLGYAPQIKGAIIDDLGKLGLDRAKVQAFLDAPLNKVFSKETYENLPNVPDYVTARDAEIERAAKLAEANPKAHAAGVITGIFSPSGFSGATLKGAPLVSRLARAGLTGAANSLVYNPGDEKGIVDPLQARERSQNAVAGGGLALLLGSAGEAAKAAAPLVRGKAEKIAARALGRGTKRMKDQMGEKGLKEMGRAALDSGVVGWIPRGINKLDERASNLRNAAGEAIGEVVDRVDDLENAARAEGFKAGISKASIAQSVIDDVLDPSTMPDPDFISKTKRRLDNFINIGGADDVISTKGAQTIKTRLGKAMDRRGVWARARKGLQTVDDVFELSLYDRLNQAVMDGAEGTAKVSGKPELVEQAVKAKNLYKAASNMSKITQDEIARSNTNNLLGLISVLGGIGAGTASDDAVTGLATAATIQALKRGGPQTGAKAIDLISQILERAGKLPASGRLGGVAAGEALKTLREGDSAMGRRLKGK